MLPERLNESTGTPLAKTLLRWKSMRAMALTRPASGTVEAVDLDLRAPGPSEVSVRVLACGVCRTDLHVVDGDCGRVPRMNRRPCRWIARSSSHPSVTSYLRLCRG
jgi:Alcohol dehydrogenase GroES-like domain